MQSSRESSHAYTKNAGEQCSSIGRVTAPYKICHSLKCGCFTWIHTFAALIAPHYLGLPPGVIPWYFAAMLHYLILFFNMSAACSFSLPYLRSSHVSSTSNSWPGGLPSSIFYTCAVHWSCTGASLTPLLLAWLPSTAMCL